MLGRSSNFGDRPDHRAATGSPEVGGDDESFVAAMADALRRRAAGETLLASDVETLYPSCSARILRELASSQGVRDAFNVRRRAGTGGAADPIRLLNDDELERPITVDNDDGGWLRDAEAPTAIHLPAIDGYRILNHLDSGGQAAVFRAIQESTGKPVAIKVLAGGAFSASRQRARFDREASVLAAGVHPNVVAILDRGRAADGSWYIVMPFVDGVSIDEHCRGADARAVVGLFARLADAVGELHRRGIVHRDLKPSNVLVDARGEPQVLDLGLARGGALAGFAEWAVGPKTATGQIVGSLPWASPEHVTLGAEVGPPADVYSIGVMLYEAIAGRPPYPTVGTLTTVVRNICESAAAAPSRWGNWRRLGLGTAWRSRLDAVVLACLQKSPAARYRDAVAVATDLKRVLAGGRIHGVDSSKASTRGMRRRLRVTLLLVVVAAASTAVFVAHRVGPWRARPVEGPARAANSLGMRFVRVEPIQYSMGSHPHEVKRRPDELRHVVALTKAFEIADTEVTRRQYRVATGTLPVGGGNSPSQGEDEPVTSVTWDEAVAFCRLLSEREHQTYRLPTEAEWERACRAGRATTAPVPSDRLAGAWCAENSGGRLHEVRSLPPNALGLYGMLGNAAEWCADGYAPAYPSNISAPIRDPVGPADAPERVLRGGSVQTPLEDCRPAARDKAVPSARRPDVGFRIVRDE